jgi:hypothetical protein
MATQPALPGTSSPPSSLNTIEVLSPVTQNYIRKSFNYEYYEQELHHPQASHHAHIGKSLEQCLLCWACYDVRVINHGIDHCINALRQVIQCHGDLTPLPKFRDMETGYEYTDFERVHTCRNFQPLRDWADDRGYDALVESLPW